MKFIISYITLLLLASLISTAKIKNKQLFEVVQKTLDAQDASSKNSLFSKFEKVNLF